MPLSLKLRLVKSSKSSIVRLVMLIRSLNRPSPRCKVTSRWLWFTTASMRWRNCRQSEQILSQWKWSISKPGAIILAKRWLSAGKRRIETLSKLKLFLKRHPSWWRPLIRFWNRNLIPTRDSPTCTKCLMAHPAATLASSKTSPTASAKRLSLRFKLKDFSQAIKTSSHQTYMKHTKRIYFPWTRLESSHTKNTIRSFVWMQLFTRRLMTSYSKFKMRLKDISSSSRIRATFQMRFCKFGAMNSSVKLSSHFPKWDFMLRYLSRWSLLNNASTVFMRCFAIKAS